MTDTDKQKGAEQSGLVSEAERAELPVNAETEQLLTDNSDNGADIQPAKPRPALRWFVILLLIALVGVGYVNRTRLRNWFVNDSAQTSQVSERKILYWVDPMHPAYKSDKPGTAPDCGMDLVPVYESDPAQPGHNLSEGTVHISPEKQQLIGVQYGTAEYKAVSRTLRTVGRLAYDETKITRIHPRIEGWIEEVFVDFTGKQVKQGQPLISIYSPELWQTQQEYLLALRGRDELADSPFREAVTGSVSLLQAARRRLELWDIEMKQLEHLEHTGKPFRALTLYVPADGFVLTRNAFTKQRITPETELYAIADFSTIWVLADLYEYEAPEVRLGQRARITLSYLPGKTFRGRVTYIYPQLDNATRTLKVRLEVPNPGFILKPDMYANVEMQLDYGRRVVVPQQAVMDSGAEQIIFVAHEGGYFEPRRVQLGAKVDNEFIVLSGVQPGERVVTSANFLIDSESQLKSATGGMGRPGHSGGHGGDAPAGKVGAADRAAPQLGKESAPQLKQAKPPKPGDEPVHRHEE